MDQPRPPSFLDVALGYARRGWPVVPLWGKAPSRLPNWPTAATTEPARLEAWFGPVGQYLDATGIGIVTGHRSQLLALDIDPRSGGDDSLRELEAAHGRLPATPINLTGGGGQHYLFQLPPSLVIQNSAGKVAPGIDVRAIGGQIAVYPSLHDVTGRRYEWDAAFHPDETPVAPLPPWLLLVIQQGGTVGGSARQAGPRRPPADGGDWIIEGNRNSSLMSRAGVLRRGGLSPDATLAALLKHNEEKVVPPLSESEVASIVNSAFHYEGRNDPTIVEIDYPAIARGMTDATSPEDVATFLRSLAMADEVTVDYCVKEISDNTPYSQRGLRRQLKMYRADVDKATKEDQKTARQVEIESIVNGIGERILYRTLPGTQPKGTNAHLISHGAYGATILPFWGTGGEPAPSVKVDARATLAGLRDLPPERIADDSGAGDLIAAALRALEVRVADCTVGRAGRWSTGPFLDPVSGIFRTQSDVSAGIVVVRDGSTLVQDAPAPRQDDAAFAQWMQLFGMNAWAIAAHVLAAMVNELPEAKHILTVTGSSGSGKSTISRHISATLGDGYPVAMAAAGLAGQWPRFLAARSPIIDNLDNAKMPDDVLDTLTSAISSGTITAPARYTHSGIEGELGYVIITSTHHDALGRYGALKSRAVRIIQNHDESAAELADEAPGIIAAARLHLWWLAGQYVADRALLPPRPAGLRIRNYARAVYWLAKRVQGLADDAIGTMLASLQAEESGTEAEDGSDPFVSALCAALDAAWRSEGWTTGPEFAAGDIADLLRKYCPPALLRRIRVSHHGKPCAFEDHPSPGHVVAKQIGQVRVSNRIGSWKCHDRAKVGRGTLLYMFHPVAGFPTAKVTMPPAIPLAESVRMLLEDAYSEMVNAGATVGVDPLCRATGLPPTDVQAWLDGRARK